MRGGGGGSTEPGHHLNSNGHTASTRRSSEIKVKLMLGQSVSLPGGTRNMVQSAASGPLDLSSSSDASHYESNSPPPLLPLELVYRDILSPGIDKAIMTTSH